jgi:hypothetical protein
MGRLRQAAVREVLEVLEDLRRRILGTEAVPKKQLGLQRWFWLEDQTKSRPEKATRSKKCRVSIRTPRNLQQTPSQRWLVQN